MIRATAWEDDFVRTAIKTVMGFGLKMVKSRGYVRTNDGGYVLPARVHRDGGSLRVYKRRKHGEG